MKMAKENEVMRMGAAISFAVIILVIGIPLWWKTTEVYRVPLPNTKIEALKDFDYRITIRIHVSTIQPTSVDGVMKELKKALSNVKMFNITFVVSHLKVESRNVKDLEENTKIHNQVPGDLLLVEVPEQYNGNDIVLGNHRAIYFTKGSSIQNVALILTDSILQDNDLRDTVMSILKHRSTELVARSKNQERRVRASPNYDIIFTTISPQPEKVKMDYSQESVVVRFFQPLASQLELLAEHKLKSQWLYFVELGQQPKKIGQNYILTSDQLPHIISPLEKKLGSGVSKHPCLHFIMYVALCEESPLFFRTRENSLVNAVLSPRWGGIQLLNPEPEYCNGSTPLKPNASTFMSTFLAQLRALLGIPEVKFPTSIVLPLKSVKLRSWEIDILYRLRALEQISLAQMTLQSLSQLLEEISNIVINEEVGASVHTAVNHIESGQSDLINGNLTGALFNARKSFDSAENAFTHPSLLALLYFPDDQKYAVYIPLFIPIMIPVLLSMRSIQLWKKLATGSEDKDDEDKKNK